MKNKMKINFGLGIIFILFLISIGGANAISGSFTTPKTNTNITISPYTLNANFTPDIGFYIANVTFRYSTDDTSYTLINATVSNSSTGQTAFNTSWDWSAIANGAYYINATAIEDNATNITGAENTTSVQVNTVGLDNTPPTINTVTYTNSIQVGKSQIFTVNSSDIGFINGVATCNINIINNGVTQASTISLSHVSLNKFTGSTTVGQGLMEFTVTCTDNHNFVTISPMYKYATFQIGRSNYHQTYSTVTQTPQNNNRGAINHNNIIEEIFGNIWYTIKHIISMF